jgi:hypothetical protein
MVRSTQNANGNEIDDAYADEIDDDDKDDDDDDDDDDGGGGRGGGGGDVMIMLMKMIMMAMMGFSVNRLHHIGAHFMGREANYFFLIFPLIFNSMANLHL